MPEVQMIPIVLLPALLAGTIQTVTGFGGGIIMMLFFPLVMPMLKASALSTLITLYLTATLSWKLRRQADWSVMFLPLAVFLVSTTLALQLAMQMDTQRMTLLFGAFLMALSVYFIRFSDRIHLKASQKNGSICAALSGLCSGMFGISGPPMVVYYLSVLGDDKMRYLATTQVFFCLSSIYNTAMRVARGILTADMIPLFLFGLVGMAAGKRIGLYILSRIDAAAMKKAVYVFLAISGAITLVRGLV